MKQPNGPRQLPIFVYGTLRPGESNFGLVQPAIRAIAPAVTDGLELWNLGLFPMAVEGAGRVWGDLLTLDAALYESTLEALDRLEGVNPGAPTRPGGLYWRARCEAKLLDDSATLAQAWIYRGEARAVRRGRKIMGGDWKQRR